MNKNYRERLEEASEWLRSMYDLLSLKTDVEDIEFTQKKIDLFEWMIEQINRLYGGETFKGYKEMYEYSERIKNNALEQVQELEEANKNMYWTCSDLKFENLQYRETIKKATDILDDFERYGNKCATKAYITLIEALESEST